MPTKYTAVRFISRARVLDIIIFFNVKPVETENEIDDIYCRLIKLVKLITGIIIIIIIIMRRITLDCAREKVKS